MLHPDLMANKRLAIVSDIHVGHKLAVAPPDAEIPQENEDSTHLELNKVQKALYQAWQDTTEAWKKPDYLVINGEPIEGQQPKNLGNEVWTTDVSAQLRRGQDLDRYVRCEGDIHSSGLGLSHFLTGKQSR